MKFIFEITVKPGYRAEDYASAWVKASEIIQRAPGAMGTELHRKIGEPSKLIAIAHWRSKRERDAMEAQHNATVAEIIRGAAAFVTVQVIGEYEEPEWVVMPSTTDY